MVRKWEAMFYLRKTLKFSLFALILGTPGLTLADSVVTTKVYVDGYAVAKNQGNANAGKVLVVNTSGVVGLSDAAPDLTNIEHTTDKLTGANNSNISDTTSSNEATKYPSAKAVKNYAVKIAQGVGDQNANVGKGLIVNSSGNLALSTILQSVAAPTTTITNGATASNNDGYVVRSVSVASDNKTINVVRDTVKIPVAAGAPSSNTPSDFSEIWLSE